MMEGLHVATTTATVLCLLCSVVAAASTSNGDVNAHKYHIGQRCELSVLPCS